MQKEDIEHLALLARIELRPGEAEVLAEEVGSILGYVSEIRDITGEGAPTKTVGPLFNVFREDANPNTPGTYTEDLLNAAPEREGRYVRVKKILDEK